jgi:hypothetical protein
MNSPPNEGDERPRHARQVDRGRSRGTIVALPQATVRAAQSTWRTDLITVNSALKHEPSLQFAALEPLQRSVGLIERNRRDRHRAQLARSRKRYDVA